MTRKKIYYDKIVDTLKKIIKGTKYEGHVFTVGGCERDRILGNPIKDVDIVIDLPNGGIEFANWLNDNNYTNGSVVVYEHYGTAMFRLSEIPDDIIEAVQTRRECYRNMESRNPETAFGTIMEDCSRRDFTINAIYRNVSTGEVLDLTYCGQNDLSVGLIRTCGEPDIIFNEDPLRILRAIRFKCRLNFNIDEETYDGMVKNVDRLSIISRERITDEFSKMIQSTHAKDAITSIIEIGGIKHVIPCDLSEDEIIKRLYHNDSLSSIDNVSSSLAVRLSRVFVEFGLDKTEEILKNMKYSNDIIKDVLWYKKHNNIDSVKTMHGLRKLLYECGDINHFINVLGVYEFYGINKYKTYSLALRNIGNTMFNYKLPLNGNDIMEVLNISGGPIIKKILNDLMNIAFINPDITKDDCIKYVKEHYSK